MEPLDKAYHRHPGANRDWSFRLPESAQFVALAIDLHSARHRLRPPHRASSRHPAMRFFGSIGPQWAIAIMIVRASSSITATLLFLKRRGTAKPRESATLSFRVMKDDGRPIIPTTPSPAIFSGIVDQFPVFLRGRHHQRFLSKQNKRLAIS